MLRLLFSLPLTLALCGAVSVPHAASDPGATRSAGDDWPQWRGPARTGVSSESDWSSEGKPQPLWTKDLGLGHASFAVADGRLFTLGYDAEAGLDTVFCLDADSGAELWTHRYPSEIWDVAHDGGAITTPTVVGDVVYTSNREGKVFCFGVAEGDVRWQRDLRADFELEPPTWGFSASPFVLGERVILSVDRVVALDRHTGEDLWVSEASYGIAYSTPTVFEQGGDVHLVNLTGQGLALLDAADGRELAKFEWIKEPRIYPMTPVVIDDRIFISAGYERGCTMLRYRDGELEELWSSRVMRNKMSGCILWRDHLFGFDESILKCITLDGEERWRKRGLGTGSMSLAGGRLVILDGKGQVVVAEANPEAYVELSRQPVLEGGTAWSTPVLSHGRIYCRSSLGQMACLDHRGGEAAPATPLAGAASDAEIPTASALAARHVAALGDPARIARLRSVRLSGPGESLRNTVRTGPVAFHWVAGEGFAWRDDSGFEVAHDADIGWIAGDRGPAQVLEGEALHAVREAGDMARLLDPAGSYASLGAVQRTVFDNRDCWALEATTEMGYVRTLYFEVESGLLAGHNGEGISMWTLADYREFDGLRLPTRWAFYEPIKGEMNSAHFDAAVLDGEWSADAFTPPAMVQLFLRSPEEVAQANEDLTREHADILGLWRDEEGPEDAPGMRFEVADGFLMMQRRDREPAHLAASEEPDVVHMIGAEYVTFTVERDADGRVEAIQIRVGEELRSRLRRVETL